MEAKQYLEALDIKARTQQTHEGQLTLSHGTVPYTPVPLAMPATHAQWDELATQLPIFIGNFTEREALKRLPVISASENDLDDKYLTRASIILSSFAHAYYYNQNSVPVDKREKEDPLPDCIEIPWQQITKRLRPHLTVPARTAFDSVLCNWKLRGSIPLDLSTLSIDDLDLLVPIVGNEEERIFFLTILLMEMKFAPALAAIVEAQTCTDTRDNHKLYQCLSTIVKTLRDVTTTINIISQNSFKHSYVDPVVWTKSVIKLEENIRPGEISGSGASLPLFHIMDAFINRKFNSSLGQHLLKFKKILPKTHAEFIDILYKPEVSVIDYAIKHGDYRLKKKCDELLNAYEHLLTTHMVKAFGYIYLSFNIGRKRTHGGQDESSQITQALKESISERRRALNVSVSSATVIANNAIGKEAHEIILEIPDNTLHFQPGDKCAIYPQNPSTRINNLLDHFRLSGDEPLQLTSEWREYFVKLSNSTETTIKLREFLRYADLDHNQPFLKITSTAGDSLIEQFGKILKPLTPRLYSVAPIPNASLSAEKTKKIRLTVKEIHHPQGLNELGVASSYLCRAEIGAQIKIDTATVLPFELPKNPDTPIIMFAGGTGIAPFIGFIDERAHQNSLNNNWLFFSTTDRHQLYYQQHLEELIRANHLQYHAIFSKEKSAVTFDSQTKALSFIPNSNANGYINKLITASAEQLAELIVHQNAHIYVCGHAKFAEAVQKGLAKILLPYFHYDAAKVNAAINALMNNGKYHQDVFTRDIVAPTQQFSIAEVAKHNDKELWVIIDNKVYDLTDFAGQHPGGEKIFRAIAGKNADRSYQVINHHMNQQINSLLDNLQIGEIKPLHLDHETSAVHARWANVLQEITGIENILNYGFDVKNKYQEIYLHSSVFDAYISRYLQLISADNLGKLELSTQQGITSSLLHEADIQKLLALPTLVKDVHKTIVAHGPHANTQKLQLLQACASLIALSRKIINKQKNLIIKGIFTIEAQTDNYQQQLTQLTDQYKALFLQYREEVNNLYLNLLAIKNDNAVISSVVKDNNSVVIVGGGLTGIVLSAFLAKLGLSVTVYDALPDPREAQLSENRSINITLCERGLSPLRSIGAYDAVVKACVPAKGRMIHNTDDTLKTQMYGNNGESLYSIGRHELAKTLLQFVAKNYDVKFHFQEKCLFINPDTKQLTFMNKATRELTTTTASVIIGADGGHSKVRKTLQAFDPSFTETKSKHQHAYKEIKLKNPPKQIANNMNYLHIWPRDNFMLIGFPNTDGSMTLSLHLPENGQGNSLANIKSATDYHQFFKAHFPDVYDYVKDVLDESYSYPTGHMISTKCYPWVYKSNMALIGDAAHTLFPYYGQGANCAFEDCEVLATCFRETPNDWHTALNKYQQLRKPNSDTIIDLAAKHLHILSTKVGNERYLLAEKISLEVQKVMPELRTLYHNISFSSIPYLEAVAREEIFQEMIQILMKKEDIQTIITTPEWPQFCRQTYENTLRKIALENMTNKSLNTQVAKGRASLMDSKSIHTYAGTLFFFKSPQSTIRIEPKIEDKHALFKVHEI